MSHFSSLLTMKTKITAISKTTPAIMPRFDSVNSIIFSSLLVDSIIFFSPVFNINCKRYATTMRLTEMKEILNFIRRYGRFPRPGQLELLYGFQNTVRFSVQLRSYWLQNFSPRFWHGNCDIGLLDSVVGGIKPTFLGVKL